MFDQSSAAVVVLDGPPASGKSTIAERLKGAIKGRRVMYMDEPAGGVFSGGYPVPISGADETTLLQLQRAIYEFALGVENHVRWQAVQQKVRLIVADRALPTGAAYAPDGVGQWYNQVARHSQEELFSRYKTVIYLPSLATFNPSRYEELKASNPFRRESAVEAAELDARTWSAWEGHPNLIRMPGELGLDVVYEEVLKILSPLAFGEVERKWLLLDPPQGLGEYLVHERLEQYYLSIVPDGELRYRRVATDGVVECWETEKSGSGLVRGEVETLIPESRYLMHRPSAQGSVITKDRFGVLDGGGQISVDFFRGSLEGHVTLEREFDSEEAANDYELPSAWQAYDPVEVTGNKAWSNSRLALVGLPT